MRRCSMVALTVVAARHPEPQAVGTMSTTRMSGQIITGCTRSSGVTRRYPNGDYDSGIMTCGNSTEVVNARVLNECPSQYAR